MLRRTIAIAACAVSIVATTTSARAQGPAPSDEAQAEELAARAYEHYKAKDYEKAIATYQQAYRTAPLAPILFNLANLYDKKLHDADHAIDFYRRYLRATDADPELAKKAKDRIALLQLQAETRPPAPPPAAPSAAPKDPPREAPAAPPAEAVAPAHAPAPAPGLLASPYRPYALVAGGAGAVALGIGIAFGASALAKNGEAEKMCSGGECFDPKAPETNASARSAAAVSTTAFVVSGIALAGAAVLWFLPAPTRERPAGVRASVGPTGFSLAGAF